MNSTEITNQYTTAEICAFNANASVQGAETFAQMVNTALDFEAKGGAEGQATEIVKFAVDSAINAEVFTGEAEFTKEEIEDLKQYA